MYDGKRRRQAREAQVANKDVPKDWGFDMVAFVAEVLDRVAIPNVVWGNQLLRFYGVPTLVNASAFFYHLATDRR